MIDLFSFSALRFAGLPLGWRGTESGRLTPNMYSYGIGDIIDCRGCSGSMRIYRRGPHPKWSGYEVQRFECPDCKSQLARTVDKDGLPARKASGRS